MKVLVTGGAGFIGSHVVDDLIKEGHDVVVIDNLSGGYRESVHCEFVEGCLSDKKKLSETFEKYSFDAVIHFAGFIEAGESMVNPAKFFENNISNGINLLEAMVKNGVKKIVFSSSAAVYQAKNEPLLEEDAKNPVNVYGDTKLMFEKILAWYDHIYGLKSVCLRYFNAAGDGEQHSPETHLIPLIMFTALGKRKEIKIFGTDYETHDGTCIRDYVHVNDLASAHVLALNVNESKIYNVGTGQGYSVKEVIEMVKKVTGKDFTVTKCDRRPGDAAVLVADSSKIQNELGWKAEYDLRKIIESAWGWFNDKETL